MNKKKFVFRVIGYYWGLEIVKVIILWLSGVDLLNNYMY